MRPRIRGQAMVEYSIILWILVSFLLLGLSVPLPISSHKNLIEVFMDAYQSYYDSFYFALDLPFP